MYQPVIWIRHIFPTEKDHLDKDSMRNAEKKNDEAEHLSTTLLIVGFRSYQDINIVKTVQ